MVHWKPFGYLSIVAGVVAFVGIIGLVPIIFIAPVGITSGIIAVCKKHRLLGWIGLGLNILAITTEAGVLYHYGWFGK